MKATENTYLVIPYDQLTQAKKVAGRLENNQPALGFDEEKKLWYARPGADLDRLSLWRVDAALVADNRGHPQQEFSDFIRACGGDLNGLAVMDGKTHRIRMDDDKSGSKSGVYVGHLDGFANGWFADHRTGGDRQTWSSRSAKPDPVVAAHRRAQLAQEQQRREANARRRHDQVARKALRDYAPLPPADSTHPYLQKKGVDAGEGLRLTAGNDLIIPLTSATGDIRTLQTIAPDGSKRLMTGGEKAGSFHVTGGELKNGEPLVFAEGYATARSASQALGYPVIMTVDSGNLVTVAKALHARYPDSPTLFLGDDDLPKPKRPGNPGREKAEEAARLTGGHYILPVFTPEARAQGLTDFNDLHHAQGIDALAAQIRPAFDALPRHTLSEEVQMNDHTPAPPADPIVPGEDRPPRTDHTPPPADLSDYGPLAEQVFEQEREDAVTPVPASTEPSVEPAPGETGTAESDAIPAAPEETAPVIPEPEETQPALTATDEPPPPTIAEQTTGETTTEAAPAPADTATETPPEPPLAEDTPPPLPGAGEDAEAAHESAPRPQDPQPTPGNVKEEEAQATAPPQAGPEATTRPTSTEDAIHIDTGGDARRATPIDLDALMQNITHEMMPDGRAVRYLYAGDEAFVDHGHRIAMAGQHASQNDAMILAALMVARECYRGRIELTGSQDFQARAIGLIAAYNLDITMKHPHQQLMLDEARKAQGHEPAPGETPTPAGTRTAAIVPERDPATAAAPTPSSAPAASDLPPELRPTVTPQEGPKNASRQETEKGLTGTLLDYGPAPYQFDKTQNPSYFVHLRTEQGERVIWGKELATAVGDSGLKKGDVATLTWLGNKEVEVTTKMRDENGKVMVDENGVEKTEVITAKRNQWEMKPAIDNDLLVSHAQQSAPPASLQAYEMSHYAALQAQVSELAAKTGVTLPPLSPASDLVWFKPNGEGTTPPATRPAQLNVPTDTAGAGTVLMQAMSADNQLKMLLVKGPGDYVQGTVLHEGAYQQVIGKLCTRDNGSRYLTLNALTPEGPKIIGYGNPVNHEAGAYNAFVFRLKGEQERLYAPLTEPEKCPPALHKQLGFTHDYVPPSPSPQPRETDRVEQSNKPKQSPRPGM
ncbi:LPD7 domain-containing protein [Klebsiella michiganensis]|uniref:LPD7 domain-containing protein n=1 Tax=Klebsiella michiganensis TaxID=1134687 RepID=UPI003F4FCFC2